MVLVSKRKIDIRCCPLWFSPSPGDSLGRGSATSQSWQRRHTRGTRKRCRNVTAISPWCIYTLRATPLTPYTPGPLRCRLLLSCSCSHTAWARPDSSTGTAPLPGCLPNRSSRPRRVTKSGVVFVNSESITGVPAVVHCMSISQTLPRTNRHFLSLAKKRSARERRAKGRCPTKNI